jgi:tetratricopeptide (TPR) repeat protein
MTLISQLVEQALTALHAGNSEEAAAIMNAVVPGQEGYGLSLFIRGEAERQAGNFFAAETLFLRAIEAGYAGAELYFRLGMARLAQVKLQDAEQAFITCLEDKRDHAQAWFYVAVLRLQMGRAEEAEPAARIATNLDETSIPAWDNLATCLMKLGKAADAILALERAWQLDQTNRDRAHRLMQYYTDEGRYDAARVLGVAMAQHYPEDFWWNGAVLGWVSRAANRLADAAGHYRRAIVLAPEIGDSWSSLGLTLRSDGHLTEAHAILERALALNPVSAESHFGLAGVDLDQGQYRKALEQLDRFEAVAPGPRRAKRSIVIPVLDYSPGSPFNIRTLLDDLKEFDGEVICIFNGTEVFNDLHDHPRIDKYSFNKFNVGVARGWNMGINQAEGDSIHVLNADLKISVAMLYRLEEWLHKLPDAICVGVSADWFDFDKMKVLRSLNSGAFTEPLEADMVSGQLFTLHAERLNNAGITFDPRLSPYFGEEIDLGLKAKQAGYKIYAVPETDYEHSWGISKRDRPIYCFGRPVHRLRCLVRNQALLGRKSQDMGFTPNNRDRKPS